MRNKTFFHSLKNATKGLRYALAHERNLQIEISALLLNIILIFYFDLTALESALILIVCALVLGLELLNTAIEKLADVVQPSWNITIGQIKDIAAGATLVAALVSLIVGGLVYYPYVVQLIQ